MTVKELREKSGLTQVELCKRAGICRTTLDKIENMRSASVSTATVKKLSNALKVSEAKIFSALRPQK